MTEQEELAYFEVLHNYINTLIELEKVACRKSIGIPEIRKNLIYNSDAYIVLLEG